MPFLAPVSMMHVPVRRYPSSFVFASNGDTRGIIYFAGRGLDAFGTWTNPHTAGRVVCVRSSDLAGAAVDLVDHATNNTYGTNAANSFAAVDFLSGRSVVVTKYSLRNNSNGDRATRNWKLQGSNDPASNSVSDLAAATWTDIDTRVADTTMTVSANSWGAYTVSGTPSAYRWLRILQNGVDNLGEDYLSIAELEFYGTFSY